MSEISICGWDIGGAHVKLAGLDEMGRVVYVDQIAAPLWQDPDMLDKALAGAGRAAGLDSCRHALTMTGELADCFSDRTAGVATIVERFTTAFPGVEVHVYAGSNGFVEPDRTGAHAGRIASANWLATTAWVASHYTDGVLVDIGSTTTDIIPFRGGVPAGSGVTDFERLRSGELLYTGIVRTPVMAVVRQVPYRGKRHPVIPEHFATMADVYRLTGDLKPHHDLMGTPDGRSKSREDSARRLARMLGLDLDAAPSLDEWTELARHIAGEQWQRLDEALPALGTGQVLVGAGSGRFLLSELARRRGCRFADFDAHLEMDAILRDKSSDCAAAVSVAQLARSLP
jgi:probable H4MPT-linked C1 transfer pathway protein